MFVHFNRKNRLLFYNPNNKTFIFPYHSASANILDTNVLLCTVNICAVTQGTFCFSYMMCLCPSHAEMGLFPTTQFPGNRTPISLQVRCPWWPPCGVWPTRRRARWDRIPAQQNKNVSEWTVPDRIVMMPYIMMWQKVHLRFGLNTCYITFSYS